MSSQWEQARNTEVNKLRNIKDSAEKLEPNFRDFAKYEKKGKAFRQYMKTKFISSSVDTKRTELESELTELLKDVLQGLQEINSFLEAVEKLASTSLEVFTENQLLHLPRDVTLNYIQAVVWAAKVVCPLVLEFKMDMDPFFLPRFQNLEVLAYQLEKYIQTTSTICEKFGKSDFSDFDLETVGGRPEVDLSAGLPDEDIQRMLDHINQLVEIRNDQHFRMAFLFQQKPGEHFITEFKNRQPGMLTFLKDLEETAVQLDIMNKGARISTVAGSSVGAVGGVLSIVGLALIPVTAGVSLSLTLAGVGLAVTSGVNSMVTTATEIGVNKTRQRKAKNTFQRFMEDVQSIEDCLDEACQAHSKLRVNKREAGPGVVKILGKIGAVGKGIHSMVDAASALKLLRNGQAAAGAGKVLAQEGKALGGIPRVAADIPDIGQAAAKTSVAVTKTARAGFITLNALFLGMDIFMICKTSVDLAKGSETQVSKLIRARAALWSSVMDSWQKTFDSLVQGLDTLEEKEAVLETPFYPRQR
ncbi:uncharacterized protein LOC115387044 [Salarias fasciatus]|uniref:uncharacterized protein LOC115387044 n=1 Tax=Salarias fasciatus TaxID=181472 RepID=UPI00117686B7|nr:uncharacterized protein LOC115387044 [Salarias fasciatus]